MNSLDGVLIGLCFLLYVLASYAESLAEFEAARPRAVVDRRENDSERMNWKTFWCMWEVYLSAGMCVDSSSCESASP